jgi:hypothetical protein
MTNDSSEYTSLNNMPLSPISKIIEKHAFLLALSLSYTGRNMLKL